MALAARQNNAVEQIVFYRDHPVAFVEDIILRDLPNIRVEPEQAEILNAIAGNAKVSVRSGRNIGKSTTCAWAVLWWLSTFNRSRVLVTAPSSSQLHDVLWAETLLWYRHMQPAYQEMFEHVHGELRARAFPEYWAANFRTAPKENPESIIGRHADNFLVVVDEASGVADVLLSAIVTGLTGPNNKVILISNPRRTQGYYFDTHHVNRDQWSALHYSSENSALVPAAVKEEFKALERKWGRDSAIFRTEVLGLFPLAEADQFIPLDIIEDAIYREVEPAGQRFWGLDVARFGDDETALAKRHGDVLKSLEGMHQRDTMQVAGWVAAHFNETPRYERPTNIMVDVIGIGAGVVDRLHELGLPVVGVNVAESPSVDGKYLNLRAELYDRMRQWLYARRGSIPDDRELTAQLTSLKYDHESSGKLRIESKKHMKDRGVPSPDRADAVMLTFASPIVVDEHPAGAARQWDTAEMEYDPFQ
uniref:Putative helicase n=1 Tax=viral metagenome TaxID=1070528 RepID=A0A6M3XI27_9ZZZZ